MHYQYMLIHLTPFFDAIQFHFTGTFIFNLYATPGWCHQLSTNRLNAIVRTFGMIGMWCITQKELNPHHILENIYQIYYRFICGHRLSPRHSLISTVIYSTRTRRFNRNIYIYNIQYNVFRTWNNVTHSCTVLKSHLDSIRY